MLKVGYEIPRGKGQKLVATVADGGVHLDFYKEFSPKSWEDVFSVVMDENNFAPFHDSYTRLVYAAGDIHSVDSATLPGVSGRYVGGNLSMRITKGILNWYKVYIITPETGQVHYEFNLRRSELINIMEETQAYLRNSARR